MDTFVWLGATREFVGQFVPLPLEVMLRKVAGLPPMLTLDEDVEGLDESFIEDREIVHDCSCARREQAP
jgi:hypothetical protein